MRTVRGSGTWTIRAYLPLVVLAAFGRILVAPASAQEPTAVDDRPNILFILTDDQRWDAMSCMDHPFLRTPSIDRLAAEGVRFENAFVTTSLCSPSRASFLTGVYAHRHGVVTNAKNDPAPAFLTFPHLLQQAGYETAFIGKWHMAPSADPRPGFDHWLSFRGQGTYIDPELNENGRDFKATGYMTDLLTDAAVAWLARPRQRPFCLILSHKAVHGPFTPAPRHAEAFTDVEMPEPAGFQDDFADKPGWIRRSHAYGGRRPAWIASQGKPVPARIDPVPWDPRSQPRLDYYRTLLAVDESVGRVLEELERQAVLDRTFVVFASDNGFFQGEHRRGDKRLAYEESIRIPFLVRHPPLVRAGTTEPAMALNIDLAPTLLALAHVPVPDMMQGISLLPLFSPDRASWRSSFLYEYFREAWVPGIPLMLGIRTKRWKYVAYPDIEDIDELYDLKADPCELHNLASAPEQAETLGLMQATLKGLLRETAYPPEHPGAPAPENENP